MPLHEGQESTEREAWRSSRRKNGRAKGHLGHPAGSASLQSALRAPGRKSVIGRERFGESQGEIERRTKRFGRIGLYNEGETHEETPVLVLLADGRLAHGSEHSALREMPSDAGWYDQPVHQFLAAFAESQGLEPRDE